MLIKVRATRDFTVGPSHEVVIKKDDERIVNIDKDDEFDTFTNTGGFFGMCHLDRGWEVVNIYDYSPKRK